MANLMKATPKTIWPMENVKNQTTFFVWVRFQEKIKKNLFQSKKNKLLCAVCGCRGGHEARREGRRGREMEARRDGGKEGRKERKGKERKEREEERK